jgi:hypothetical protein
LGLGVATEVVTNRLEAKEINKNIIRIKHYLGNNK